MGPDAFDFWLGEWDCATSAGPATNQVTREYGGRVIVERFHVLPPIDWAGTSLSVFSDQDGWRQTWVDQDGHYWHFVGELVDGDPCFATAGRVDADQRYKRMVFSEISAESIEWRWEASEDEEEWTVLMTASYARRD